MGSSYTSVYEHIAFSTKLRRKQFTPKNERQVYSFLEDMAKKLGCQTLAVGGHQNHVHLLVRMPKGLLTEDLVRDLKKSSSDWFHEKFDPNSGKSDRFHWQKGYGAFSISYWDLDRISKYINNHHIHHQDLTWEEEFRKLLEKHGVEYDERYYLD